MKNIIVSNKVATKVNNKIVAEAIKEVKIFDLVESNTDIKSKTNKLKSGLFTRIIHNTIFIF